MASRNWHLKPATLEFSAQERLVLEHLVAGFRPSRIAKLLHRNPSTIGGVVMRIRNKIGAANCIEAAQFAIHRKLVEGEIHPFYGS